MAESRVKTGVVPPSGWHYIGDDGVRVESHDLEHLYEVVQHYRVNNSLDVGNVIEDVDSYICSNFPNQCHGGWTLFADTRLHTITVNPLTAIIDDASRWGRGLLHSKEQFDLVPDDEAQRRTAVCAECPRNMSYVGGCPDCVATLERIAHLVRRGRGVDSTQKVHACDCHRFEASAAAFVPFDKLPSRAACAPEPCWVRP